MVSEKRSKIQQLLLSWPSGTVFTSATLKKRGYSDVLLHHYRTSGWLVGIGRGAFAKAGDVVDWRGGLFALQQQSRLPVHLGGKSALAYHGAAHFIKFDSEDVALFADPGTRLPSWFSRHDWGVPITLATTNLLPHDIGLSSQTVGSFSIQVSSRERAMLETLHAAPKNQSLSEARLLMTGLLTLRPKLVQQLLESCSSIKVKRLFLLLAEELKLPWVKKLNLDKIDLGSGDRTLVKSGKLHPKYRLTLPADLFDEGSR
jgi:hypothetical protein